MKKLSILLSLIFAVVFSACEDVIQVELDKGEDLVVIDAFINGNKTNQKVRLTYTDDYFSAQNPPAIKGANVKLTDLSNGKVYTFTDINNGDYLYTPTANDTIVHWYHSYKLEVTYNGKTYTSITESNRNAKLDSISAKYEDGSSIFASEPGYYCVLWARDLPGAKTDYYWVKTSKNGIPFNKSNQINIAIDGTNGSVPSGDTLLFTPPIITSITPFGEIYQVGDSCSVEIHSITRDTYFFLLQVVNQTNNSGLFATTPENVKTNIITPEGATKAIGWFSVANTSVGGKKIK